MKETPDEKLLYTLSISIVAVVALVAVVSLVILVTGPRAASPVAPTVEQAAGINAVGEARSNAYRDCIYNTLETGICAKGDIDCLVDACWR